MLLTLLPEPDLGCVLDMRCCCCWVLAARLSNAPLGGLNPLRPYSDRRSFTGIGVGPLPSCSAVVGLLIGSGIVLKKDDDPVPYIGVVLTVLEVEVEPEVTAAVCCDALALAFFLSACSLTVCIATALMTSHFYNIDKYDIAQVQGQL